MTMTWTQAAEMGAMVQTLSACVCECVCACACTSIFWHSWNDGTWTQEAEMEAMMQTLCACVCECVCVCVYINIWGTHEMMWREHRKLRWRPWCKSWRMWGTSRYVCMFLYVHAHTHYTLHIHIYICWQIHVRTYVCMQVDMNVHNAYTCMHTYIHVHGQVIVSCDLWRGNSHCFACI